MKNREPNKPAPSKEERRQEFAPHHNPKLQPDGDPGPTTSTREGSINERGADTPKPVEDKTAQD
jgi:hypothetical protein